MALAFGNTPKAMAPWGGTQPLYGTNPIALRRAAARPAADGGRHGAEPGGARQDSDRRAEGRAHSRRLGVDDDGKPTTDAAAALKGTLLPIGGAKGAALALMVEVLAVALTGAKFGFEASSFFDADGKPPGVGQFLIAIDPGAFAGRAMFLDRIAALAHVIEHDAGARLPGSRRLAAREKAARDGVTVDTKLLSEARALAGQ